MNVAAYPLEDTDNVLKFLRTASLSVVNKLEKLEFVQCGLNDIQAGMIVRNIVPKFPNLKNLILTRNEIKSVQSIVERIIRNDTTALPLKLFHPHTGLTRKSYYECFKETAGGKEGLVVSSRGPRYYYLLSRFEEYIRL